MADNQQEKKLLSQESYQTIEDNIAQNRVDNDSILADNILDTELLLPDNVPDTKSLLADSIEIEADLAEDTESKQIDNLVPVAINDKLSIAELQKRYKIKRAALYARLNYLNIKAWKEGNKVYLNAEQIAHMDGLYWHMNNKEKMDTYPKPKPTGPLDKVESSTPPEQTEVPEQVEISNCGAITLQQSNVEQSNINEELSPSYQLEVQPVKAQINESEMQKIDEQAQILAASRYFATQELADYYANTGNFSIPEIVEGVRQRREKTNQQWSEIHAKSDPKYVTQLLMERAKARMVVGIQNQAQPAS
jgi:hypothetical protein